MIKADMICKEIQKQVLKGRPANSFEPWGESGEKVLEGGVRYSVNFCYGSEWPTVILTSGDRKRMGDIPQFCIFMAVAFYLEIRWEGIRLPGERTAVPLF